MAGPTEGKEVYFQSFSKMWLPWDFPSRNSMSEEIRDLHFQPDIQYIFFKRKWKKSFLYNPLLLKLKSLKAAVYLLHCSRVLEGSQVSFQPGEQQKLVLYKWQAATNHLPFTPSPGWGSAAYGEQSTIPLLCSLHATKNSAPVTTVERWNTLAAAQLMY